MAIISKPDNETLAKALKAAELLREQDNDPYGIAHTLLYLSQRNSHLETLSHAAQEYIRFGEEAMLHSKLLKAIEAFEDYETEAELTEDPKFGLD